MKSKICNSFKRSVEILALDYFLFFTQLLADGGYIPISALVMVREDIIFHPSQPIAVEAK